MMANSRYLINMNRHTIIINVLSKKYLLRLVMISIWMLVGIPVDAWQASKEAQRRALMDREMDCISRQLSKGGDVTWKSTCSSQHSGTFEIAQADGTGNYDDTKAVHDAGYSDWDDPVDLSSGRYSQAERQVDSGWDDKYDDAEDIGSFGNFPSDDSSGWIDSALTTVDIGTEISNYRYSEPEFMRLKGYMWGIFGAVAFRTSDNKHIKKMGDIFSGENSINVFRLDAKFSGGDLDYESDGTGKSDDLRNYMFEVRGSVGYDIPVRRASRITPYAGFGYRYLKDDSGGTSTTTGALAYDRESFYYYLPLGIETQTKFSNSWLFEMTFEYDFFLFGTQKSHFEDVLSGYNTLYNDQDGGYGARSSFKLIKRNKDFNLYIEPFIRYWNIEDSDIDIWTYYDVPIGAGIEPANNTTEYGVKMGLRF